MNFKRNSGTIIVAVVTALLTVVIYSSIRDNGNQAEKVSVSKRSFENDTNGIHFTNLPAGFQADQFNFTLAAENTVYAVVHVKTKFTRDAQYSNPFYEFFFGDRYQRPQREVEGMGSGVIISADGYIVTNNHVVEKADNVAVTLNDGRTMEAEIVGNDPATDLALLKIDAKDLPSLKFGSSQDIKLGEWVLAVGNPFDIGTTVTAGIVSAKGRNIGVLRQRGQQGNQLAIESFIQTDAAVNKGNSGGALVNIEGELIGINAAIASPTGSYSGYSFAIPAAIARKVVEDLIKYGEVQRAMLNVQITNINDQVAKEFDLETYEGALVRAVGRDGAADKAGIKPGDVIIKVDGKDIKDVAGLQTTINSYRPGDEVTVTVKREGKEKQFDLTLRNRQGSTELVTSEQTLEKLGAQFKPIDEKLKQRIGINYGVQVVSLEEGALSNADIREGFIITAVEGRKIRNVNDIKQIFSEVPAGSKVRVEGLYPGGDYVYVYQVEMPE